jgi:hypothetical protein
MAITRLSHWPDNWTDGAAGGGGNEKLTMNY